jgi:hypothetical protein
LLHEVSNKKKSEITKNVALFNKTHKANNKVFIYCKKIGHFGKQCLKKKCGEKEKANQTCEHQEQMFVPTLNANDHTMYNWIIDFSTTQHMTFK